MLVLVAVAAAADLVLTNARLWDGSGAPVRADMEIVAHDDTVVAVGQGLVHPEGAQLLDAAGATVVPGLIDSHAHLSMDPGAAWSPPPTAEQHAASLAAHLRAYLACGITTIVDPGVSWAELDTIRSVQSGGAPGPRYVPLGPPISPEGGYVSALMDEFAPTRTVAEVEAGLDRSRAAGLLGVKVTVEDGFVFPIWPLHSREVLGAIRSGAMRRNLQLYAHAMSPREQRLAIEDLGADVLVHPLDRPDPRMVRRIVAAGAFEMTTLAVYDAPEMSWDPSRLDEPLLQLVVPADEIARGRDPAVARAYNIAMSDAVFPGVPGHRAFASSGLPASINRSMLRRTQAAIRMMQAAGVPLVMGSDAGNWPIIPYLFHGYSSIREMELLGHAGLSPVDALLAATRNPARMLGLEREVGVVRPGSVADLVVVDGDPLADLSSLRRLRWVIHDGEARRPEEWMRP
jgi:imidazolonepropionase-like amidohydrolase